MFFFFSSRRRHTRSLCDWSSDVCSSDLTSRKVEDSSTLDLIVVGTKEALTMVEAGADQVPEDTIQIGRASCRERGERSEAAASIRKEGRTRRPRRTYRSSTGRKRRS